MTPTDVALTRMLAPMWVPPVQRDVPGQRTTPVGVLLRLVPSLKD